MQKQAKYYYALYFSEGYNQNKKAVLEIFRRRFQSQESSFGYRKVLLGCSRLPGDGEGDPHAVHIFSSCLVIILLVVISRIILRNRPSVFNLSDWAPFFKGTPGGSTEAEAEEGNEENEQDEEKKKKKKNINNSNSNNNNSNNNSNNSNNNKGKA